MLNSFFKRVFKKAPKEKALVFFSVPLVEHCNLKCKGCDHFAPLAEVEFTDLKVFEKDIKRLAKLFDTLKYIGLMGGEPLLHPKVTDFFEITRKNCKKSKIVLYTNGILLEKQPQTFWDSCKKHKITIGITKYPLKLNYANIEKTAFESKVKMFYVDESDKIEKTSYKNVIDIEAKQDMEKSYKNCFHIQQILYSLKKGRFYPCTIAPNAVHFSKYFNIPLEVSDKDGIEIHKVKSAEEILRFISKPIPFCKYCNTCARSFGHKWGVSKKEISEWIMPSPNF